MTTRRAPVIELTDVDRAFGSRLALKDISLTIAPGEKVALAGPSGGGKTTFLRLVAGALRTTRGSVRIDGADLNSMSARSLRGHRRRCGIIDQANTLVGELSVHRNVLAGFLPRWPLHRILVSAWVNLEEDAVSSLLKQVGLADRQWDRASELSGGQQQRVSIARAFASAPTLLLADEPTASLDPETASKMMEVLLEVTESSRATLILSTHWVSLVKPHVDRLVGIREGRVILDKPSEALEPPDLDTVYQGSRELR